MRLLILFYFFISTFGFSQEESGIGVSTLEERYDKSFIAPDLRSKHCISLGILNAQTTPDQTVEASGSWHIGYNYLILNQRKLKLSLKDRQRTEMRAIGVHYTNVGKGEHYLMGTFFNPLIALKGRAFSFYFFSEYGLGYHYNSNKVLTAEESKIKYHLSLELFRFRLGRIPLYLHLTGTYAISNKLLKKEPWEIGYLGGLRYYFYRGR